MPLYCTYAYLFNLTKDNRLYNAMINYQVKITD